MFTEFIQLKQGNITSVTSPSYGFSQCLVFTGTVQVQ